MVMSRPPRISGVLVAPEFAAAVNAFGDVCDAEGRVIAYYSDLNPNGSQRDIAGICNEAGNVVGLMPHPEHAVEDLTGPGVDGLGFFTSILKGLVEAS
mgnify:CR=1 FL=1